MIQQIPRALPFSLAGFALALIEIHASTISSELQLAFACLMGYGTHANRLPFLKVPVIPALAYSLPWLVLASVSDSQGSVIAQTALHSVIFMSFMALAVSMLLDCASPASEVVRERKKVIELEYHSEPILDGQKGYWVAYITGTHFCSNACKSSTEALDELRQQLQAAGKFSNIDDYNVIDRVRERE